MGLLGVTLTQHNEHLPVSMMFTIFGGWAMYCVMKSENRTKLSNEYPTSF
jgi:hypothetical protein